LPSTATQRPYWCGRRAPRRPTVHAAHQPSATRQQRGTAPPPPSPGAAAVSSTRHGNGADAVAAGRHGGGGGGGGGAPHLPRSRWPIANIRGARGRRQPPPVAAWPQRPTVAAPAGAPATRAEAPLAARARATRRTPPPPPAAPVHGPPRTATPPPFGSAAHGGLPPSTRCRRSPRRRPTPEAAAQAPPARRARAVEPATQEAPAAPLSPLPPGISPPTRSRRRVCGARPLRPAPWRQPPTPYKKKMPRYRGCAGPRYRGSRPFPKRRPTRT